MPSRRVICLTFACVLAATCAHARDVVVPPVVPPGSTGNGRMEIELSLVDANGRPVPSATLGNDVMISGLGRHVVTDAPVTLDVRPTDTIPGETYYRVVVRQGRDIYSVDVQLASGDGSPVDWATFVQAGAPVDAADIWTARLFPAEAQSGQFATFVGDAWIAVDAWTHMINPPVFGNLPINGGSPAATFAEATDGGAPITHHARISGGDPESVSALTTDGGIPSTVFSAITDGGDPGSRYVLALSALSGGQP